MTFGFRVERRTRRIFFRFFFFLDGVLNENNLARVLELDPSSTDQHEEYGNQTVRQCCVIKLIELLFRVKNETNLDLSVAQCADLSKAIEFVVKFGFIPFLIPTVWNSFDNKQKIAVPFDDDMKPTKVIFNGGQTS